MNTHELDEKLTQALMTFSSEMSTQYSDYDKVTVTGGDIATLSRQTFYLLDDFRKNIISYLESSR